MNKLFVVILAVAAFGLAGCDWFKSDSSTQPTLEGKVAEEVAAEANAAEAAPGMEVAPPDGSSRWRDRQRGDCSTRHGSCE